MTPHQLPPLPYAKNALAPFLSEETLSIHYGKHHQAYVDNLNKLLPGTEFEKLALEEIVKKAQAGIFNNAAQIWNHTFFWSSMIPGGGGEPAGKLGEAIKKKWGSFAEFKAKFSEAAKTQFGSGWAWLVKNPDGSLEIVQTSNAGNPLTSGKVPLLTLDVWEHAYYIDSLDVWEHAYYIDFRNRRPDYIEGFFSVANWKFAEANFAR